MKTKFTWGTLIVVIAVFFGCNRSDDRDDWVYNPPTAAQFAAMREAALDGIRQNFVVDADAGYQTFTSAKGVTLSIIGSCIKFPDGSDVTGSVNLEYIEIFDKGKMAATHKPTMGLMPDGKKSMLISGGEFFVHAEKNGQSLVMTCSMNMLVPTSLTTGTVDNEMSLFNGTIDDNGNLVWEEDEGEAGGQGGVFGEGNNYYVNFGNFGWTNVDRFYQDPRPKTTILVDVPDGYDNENSSVYLSYDGEGTNALAALDTFTEEGYFSEHYGQIPIGLACHVIFVTEESGQFRYAIKGVTIAANDVITFNISETQLGTEAQLVAAINAIQ